MAITIAHASKDERGKYIGGKAGDQTGQEVCTRNYYMHSKGWYAFRPKTVAHANAIAEAMKQAANNPYIGYDQGERLDIMTALKKYGSLAKIAEPTECDCSSLIRAAIYQATGVDVGNFTTANEPSVLAKSGLFENKISVKSSTTLYDGDILVTKTKAHTVAVVSGNSRSVAVSTTPRNYLMKGDKGAEVKQLQNDLIYVGYSCGSAGADGDFGSGTDSAVRAFQKANGLTVDGKYGAKSKAKLETLVANKKKASTHTHTPTPTTYTRTQFIKDVQRAIGTTADGIVGNKTLSKLVTVSKSKNNKHAVVKPLQKYLNALGYNCGTVDGIAGSKFDSAAKAWAKANGCVVDGEFTKGGKSWRKILGVA